ncbi:hypothetical protein J2046_002952 [Rhizobium petrolearium]|uniref:hypothetical protein n=1 Tax=Neorhizobium petrolearium TaxID=515361 RepID=UPI001AEA4EB8|nr:hypothetical protein [Neorhizobium petrolearium]MBP1844685.1 hypothetical protein [Neorhizobium petrolearium]
MTIQPTARTFSALPPIKMETAAPANPLRGVLVTVFALKIVVCAFLLATVSLAPPVSVDARFAAVAGD